MIEYLKQNVLVTNLLLGIHMPVIKFRLTHVHCVLLANGEWQIVAGHVGLKINDIKILERRGKDPAEDVLSYWEVRSGTTVGALYDVLVDCELCSVADML